MRLRIAPKIVIRVSTVLTLSASLVYASVSGGRHRVNTGSAFTNQESGRNVDDQPLSPRRQLFRIDSKPVTGMRLLIFGKRSRKTARR